MADGDELIGPPVTGVPLAEIGSWPAQTGQFDLSAADLAAVVESVQCPAVRDPVLKMGHTGEHGVGDPLIGRVANMRVESNGGRLVGDFVGMPRWLVAPNGEGETVLSSAYPSRSGEWSRNHRCTLGHKHPLVLHAMSLLGVDRPAIGTLKDLHELYEGGDLVTTSATTLDQDQARTQVTVDQVRRAFYESGPGTDMSLYIREMYVDPDMLIVQDDEADQLRRYPFTVDGETVEFGEYQVVRVEYAEIASSSAPAPAAVFTQRSVADAGDRPDKAGEPTEGKTMDEIASGVRERLGLDENATDQQVLAALDEVVDQATQPIDQEPADGEGGGVGEQLTLPDGVVTVDQATLDQLRADAALGVEARQKQLEVEREELVASAIADGRIAPARRDDWLTALSVDPEGSAKTLQTLAPGLVPVRERGHSVAVSTGVAQDQDVTARSAFASMPADQVWFSGTNTEEV